MTRADSALAPFGNRMYVAYWLTGLAANFGWLIQMVGASWLMTSIGSTPELVALVQTSIALPVMLFSLPAGAIADNFGRRTMVIWSQSFLLVVSTALAVCAWFGLVTPWLLLAFTFLLGCGKALNNPGWQSLVSEIVPREDLPQAVALNSVGFNIARTVGPAIGGAIVAVVGAFAAFVVNALSNLGIIAVLLRWRGTSVPRQLPPEPVGGAMLAGLRYVAMSPNILLVVLRATTFNFGAISVMALMPLVARDLLGGGPQTYGILLGAFGIGAIVAALTSGRLRQGLSLEQLARVGFVAFAGATALIAVSPYTIPTLVAAAIAGASWLLTLSAFNSTVQMSSPRWVVSRCLALYQAASFGGNALGSWLWGTLASDFSVTTSLLVSAGVLLAGTALGLRFALRELDTSGLDPHSGWTIPKVALDILPKSGPILTTIEYSIREEDVPRFLAIMAERRRSRKRDGAWRWNLTRDMEHPELWTERYQTPTWIDTLRHRERRTVADIELRDRLNALHQGAGRPQVRHHIERQDGWSSPHPPHVSEGLTH